MFHNIKYISTVRVSLLIFMIVIYAGPAEAGPDKIAANTATSTEIAETSRTPRTNPAKLGTKGDQHQQEGMQNKNEGPDATPSPGSDGTTDGEAANGIGSRDSSININDQGNQLYTGKSDAQGWFSADRLEFIGLAIVDLLIISLLVFICMNYAQRRQLNADFDNLSRRIKQLEAELAALKALKAQASQTAGARARSLSHPGSSATDMTGSDGDPGDYRIVERKEPRPRPPDYYDRVRAEQDRFPAPVPRPREEPNPDIAPLDQNRTLRWPGLEPVVPSPIEAQNVAADFNAMVSSPSGREALERFDRHYSPLSVSQGEEYFLESPDPTVWFIPTNEGLGILLPGREIVRNWSTSYRMLNGSGAQAALGLAYDFEAGDTLEVVRPAHAEMTSRGFKVITRGRIRGISRA